MNKYPCKKCQNSWTDVKNHPKEHLYYKFRESYNKIIVILMLDLVINNL